MKKAFESFDLGVIMFLREYADEIARFALFLIFFWFGILKVFLVSPAGPLVLALLEETFLSFMSPDQFLILFGSFEVLIGLMILMPRLERITFLLLVFHLNLAVMPMYVLTDLTWHSLWVPTLIGQYIIKNAALLALGFLLFARQKPLSRSHSIFGGERKPRRKR